MGRRVSHAWHDMRWPLLGALAATAVLLGHFGFQEHFRLVGEPRSLSRTLYLSLQLFTLESGSLAPPTPWTLDVARFLAPAVSFSAVLVAIAAAFRDQLSLARLRFFRGHVVVCGLGTKGALLAAAFRESGFRVAAVEVDPGAAGIAAARQAGAVVLVGDATDAALLSRARVARARYLISLCGTDGANAQVAVNARTLRRGGGSTLNAFIHIVEPDLCALVRAGEVTAGDRSLRMEFFNIYDRAAGALLRRHPPRFTDRAPKSAGPHVVVVGLGRLGSRLVLEAARRHRAESPTAPPLRITVIDPDASSKARALVERHPRLSGVCRLQPLDAALGSAMFAGGGCFLDGEGRPDTDVVYTCCDDPGSGLEAGLAVLPHLGRQGVPVVVCLDHAAGLAGLLGGSDRTAAYRDLHAFPVFEAACHPDVLLGGTYETLARAIHDDYVLRQLQEGHTPATNPSMAPWEELPDHLKESNRDQATDIGVKLSTVGCGLAPLTDWDAEQVRFSPDEVERLARLEHDRWVRYHRESGWRYAPGHRDPERRTHPDLVPYDQLTEEKREYDRNAVRGIPAFLARAGFQAHRLT